MIQRTSAVGHSCPVAHLSQIVGDTTADKSSASGSNKYRFCSTGYFGCAN